MVNGFLGVSLACSIVWSTLGAVASTVRAEQSDHARIAGEWVAVVAAEPPSLKFPGRVDVFCGPKCTIVLTDGQLEVTRSDATPSRLSFWLDGRPSSNEFKVADVPVRLESTVKREPTMVVITSKVVRGSLQNVLVLHVSVKEDELIVARQAQRGRAGSTPVEVRYSRAQRVQGRVE